MPGTKAAETERRGQIIAAAYGLVKRGGLRAVTIRDVAARADLSAGLVIFHFKSKGGLILALLEWLLGTTTALSVDPQITRISNPLDRLIALLHQEMSRVSRDRVRVLLEFWGAGMWNKEIGVRMHQELQRYRDAFRPMCEDVLVANPERFSGVSVDGLTAVAVGFIKGCAVQSIIDPRLNVREFMRAAEGLLAAQASSGTGAPPVQSAEPAHHQHRKHTRRPRKQAQRSVGRES